MQRWEYLVVAGDQIYTMKPDDVQNYINRLGESGWELVSIATVGNVHGSITLGSGSGGGSINTYCHCKLFFKRPKP